MKLFYPHIYKTAGQSVIAAIQSHLPPDKCIDVTTPKAQKYFHSLSENEKGSFDFVYGHVDSEFCPYVSKNFKLITFIRDPVSRILSHYNYAMTEKSDPGHSLLQAEGWTFDRFIDQYVDQWNGNLQTHVLAGTAWTNKIGSTAESLDKAREKLNSSLFVGILEYFDLSFAYLATLTGWNLTYTYKNQTKDKLVSEVSTAQRLKLYEKTWADQILYRKAFQRLIGQISGVFPNRPVL